MAKVLEVLYVLNVLKGRSLRGRTLSTSST